MRVKKVLMAVLGLCRETVVRGGTCTMVTGLVSRCGCAVKVRRRGRCGRCGEFASFYDQGGAEPPWRHVDVGFATCGWSAAYARGSTRLRSAARRSPWCRGAWHDSAFTRAFEDLAVPDRSARSRTDGLRTRGPSCIIDAPGRAVNRRGRGSRSRWPRALTLGVHGVEFAGRENLLSAGLHNPSGRMERRADGGCEIVDRHV